MDTRREAQLYERSVTEAKKIRRLRWIRGQLLVQLLLRFLSGVLNVPRFPDDLRNSRLAFPFVRQVCLSQHRSADP